MGYTHYWTFKPVKRGTTKRVNTAYDKAVRQCQKVVLYWQSMHPKGNDGRLSGFSAHTEVGAYGGLNFNGVGDLGHEKFVLREYYKQNEAFNFCKTAQKPYDTVVVACLAVLKHYLGDQIEVSSDGRYHDFSAGVGLARAALDDSSIQNPLKFTELKAV